MQSTFMWCRTAGTTALLAALSLSCGRDTRDQPDSVTISRYISIDSSLQPSDTAFSMRRPSNRTTSERAGAIDAPIGQVPGATRGAGRDKVAPRASAPPRADGSAGADAGRSSSGMATSPVSSGAPAPVAGGTAAPTWEPGAGPPPSEPVNPVPPVHQPPRTDWGFGGAPANPSPPVSSTPTGSPGRGNGSVGAGTGPPSPTRLASHHGRGPGLGRDRRRPATGGALPGIDGR